MIVFHVTVDRNHLSLHTHTNAVVATFAGINPERALWYEACSENNRKVIAQGDGTWLCEYDGRSYPSMTRRYIINTPVLDATGEVYVQV